MGVYNTYSGIQLKVAEELDLKSFAIGDVVDIPDGIYVANEGIVIIRKGKLFTTYSHAIDKYGGTLTPQDIIGARNPVNEPILILRERRRCAEVAKRQAQQYIVANSDYVDGYRHGALDASESIIGYGSFTCPTCGKPKPSSDETCKVC